MLSNSYQDRLVVGGGVDRGQSVGASRKTVRNISCENTILGLIVQALEEGEDIRVRRGGLLFRTQKFDDNVGVTLDFTSAVDELGGREVVLISVHEEASVEVLNRHRDGEGGVGLNNISVLGELELRRWHVGSGSDDTHWRGVAGASLNLQTIGDREVGNSQAEVDEVVVRGQRSNLTSCGNVLAIIFKARSNNFGVQRCYEVVRYQNQNLGSVGVLNDD